MALFYFKGFMKKIILAIPFLFSLSAFAAPSSIYDLQYFPKAQTSYGTTGISYFNDQNGKDRDSGFDYSQALGYSFTDNLRINASIVYQDYNYEVGGVDGFKNPRIHLGYRVLNQDVHRLDIYAGGSVNPWGRRYYKSNDRQDAHQGGNSVDIRGVYGQKYSHFQWSVGTIISRIFQRTNKYEQSGATLREKEHNSYGFDFNLLTRLSEKSYIRTTFAYDVNEPYKVQNGTAIWTRNFTEFMVEYNYIVFSDLMLSGGFSQVTTKYHDFKSTFFDYYLSARYEF